MAFACRNLLPLIQVPPRGLWARSGEVVGTTAEAWLGRPISDAPSIDGVMLRYLAAFGPATVQDAATWSRYTGLREVFERLRPQLRTFRDESGREYFDVADAPVVDADMPAPVRFLPQYDNLLLSHADRTRFSGGADFSHIWLGTTGFLGTVLVDGMVVGMWRFGRPTREVQLGTKPATLTITTAAPLAEGGRRCSRGRGRPFRRVRLPRHRRHPPRRRVMPSVERRLRARHWAASTLGGRSGTPTGRKIGRR